MSKPEQRFIRGPYSWIRPVSAVKPTSPIEPVMTKTYDDPDFFRAFNDAMTSATTYTTDKLDTNSLLSNAYAQIMRHSFGVSHLFLHAHEYARIRSRERDELNSVTSRYDLDEGILAYLRGARVIAPQVGRFSLTSRNLVPEGTAYVCSWESMNLVGFPGHYSILVPEAIAVVKLLDSSNPKVGSRTDDNLRSVFG